MPSKNENAGIMFFQIMKKPIVNVKTINTFNNLIVWALILGISMICSVTGKTGSSDPARDLSILLRVLNFCVALLEANC